MSGIFGSVLLNGTQPIVIGSAATEKWTLNVRCIDTRSSGVDQTVQLFVSKSTTPATKDIITHKVLLASNSMIEDTGITIDVGDYLIAQATTANTVVVTAYGISF